LVGKEKSLETLFSMLEIKQYSMDKLKNLIVAPTLGGWKLYAEDAWFRQHEDICESVSSDFLRHIA
jgi:hypothetical protein